MLCCNLLGADIEAVEAVWHSLRQRDLGDRRRIHSLGVHDPELAGHGALVAHVRHQVAVVFVGRITTWHERALAAELVRAVLDATDLVVGACVVEPQLGDAVEDRRSRRVVKRRRKGAAALTADGLGIDDRELAVNGRQRPLGGLAALEVHAELVGCRLVVDEARLVVDAEVVERDARQAARVQHNVVAFLPRVDDVEDVARLELEPQNIARRARVARNDADATRTAGVEVPHAAVHDALGMELEREVEYQRVVARDRAVVHHHRLLQANVDRTQKHSWRATWTGTRTRMSSIESEEREPADGTLGLARTIGVDDRVDAVGRLKQSIAEYHHLAGLAIDLGMRRERMSELVVVRVSRNGLELSVLQQAHNVRRIVLDQRQQLAIVELREPNSPQHQRQTRFVEVTIECASGSYLQRGVGGAVAIVAAHEAEHSLCLCQHDLEEAQLAVHLAQTQPDLATLTLLFLLTNAGGSNEPLVLMLVGSGDRHCAP